MSKKEEIKKDTKVEKEITAITYAGEVGLNSREKFFVSKKYSATKKTRAEWKRVLINDGLVIK